MRESLLSEKNVTALIKFVLGQISVVTKRDEFTDYLTHIWIPHRKKIEADGSVTTLSKNSRRWMNIWMGFLTLPKLSMSTCRERLIIISVDLRGKVLQEDEEKAVDTIDHVEDGAEEPVTPSLLMEEGEGPVPRKRRVRRRRIL